MEKTLQEKLDFVRETLKRARIYQHAAAVLHFDLETICPSGGMEEQGETGAFLGNEAFRLLKDDAFIQAAEDLYTHLSGSGADPLDQALIEKLHRDYVKVKNVTPEKNLAWQKLTNRSYIRWLEAREQKDFGAFKDVFQEVRRMNLEMADLRGCKKEKAYDSLLDDYERGVTAKDLDEWFGKCKDRLLPLMHRIVKSKKKIRTDFLSRPVSEDAQRKIAEYLLGVIRYDFTRGAFTTTEHPFMTELSKNDIRVTTHYYVNNFASNIYSIVHEGGHALFSQLIPEEMYDHFLHDEMTMGMHESVSRFYENRIGRSRAFISLIYPALKELTGGALFDVSEEELYEAVNVVTPSLIRIEADELTYTLHVIIRYEFEKQLMDGTLKVSDLPKAWNDKYEEYLGVRPADDAEGVLQDVHWTWGFGYFPTYAIGNMYNAMYYNRMAGEIDIGREIRSGNLAAINDWMKEHVFKKACLLSPKEWITDITGRSVTPDDFLDYLEEKYSTLYELKKKRGRRTT